MSNITSMTAMNATMNSSSGTRYPLIAIKGLAMTPPALGRISIGKVVERNGKRLPEKMDAFMITTQVQNKEGWILHALHQTLTRQTDGGKIRTIPITLLFNQPTLNLRASYSLFDRMTGRLMCTGNGECAKGETTDGLKEVPCLSPDHCPLGKDQGCKPYGRLYVQIEGQEDELGCFIFRTTGFNSIRTLSAKLAYFHALAGSATRYLPLQLKLRAKSTTLSRRTPVYYVDLTLRDGIALSDAIKQAKEKEAQMAMPVEQLETIAQQGMANGLFEETPEEIPSIVEEFFPEKGESSDLPATQKEKELSSSTPVMIPRASKLSERIGQDSHMRTTAQ